MISVLTVSTRGAWGISSGSASPDVLEASGQAVSIQYSGKDTTEPATNLVVEECVARDSDPAFDPSTDCSALSRQFFYGLPESGEVRYGGNGTANPTAPFIGVDPVNGEWSVCDEGSGVINHQSGYFRVADTPDDVADDYFVPFTCAGGPAASGAAEKASGVSVPLLVALGAVVAIAAAVIVSRRRSTPSALRPVPDPKKSNQEESKNR